MGALRIMNDAKSDMLLTVIRKFKPQEITIINGMIKINTHVFKCMY